jgi:hypothetical protein
MPSALEPRNAPAWIVAAGLALVGLGLVAEPQDDEPAQQTRTLPLTSGFGNADSNGSMIAVTGVDVTGGSLLFLIDTEGRHISVYQATGGTSSTMNLKWVGARNIDLDLQVDGFNDKSEISYKELVQRFAESGAGATGDEH